MACQLRQTPPVPKVTTKQILKGNQTTEAAETLPLNYAFLERGWGLQTLMQSDFS